ncbi:hypothetical protein CBF18_21725, partial [Mastigocladus laminosus WC112]
MNNIGVVYD